MSEVLKKKEKKKKKDKGQDADTSQYQSDKSEILIIH